jgi:N-acetylglutamate synthase-like GNAT family acetyltransferase
MPRSLLVTSVDLHDLRCPYCGRSAPMGPERGQANTTTTGVKIMSEGLLAGVVSFAPGERPRQAVIKALWVAPNQTGRGYGRQLVQDTAAELWHHKVMTLCAVAGTRQASCATPPQGFLEAVGFIKPPSTALWELDLRRAVLERNFGPLAGLLRAFGAAGPDVQPAS